MRKILSRKVLYERGIRELPDPTVELIPKRRLTALERRVAVEYVVDFNIAKSYRRAVGRSDPEPGDKRKGKDILGRPQVAEYVKELLEEMVGSREEVVAQMYREAKRVAFYNIRDFLGPDNRLRPLGEIPREALAAVESIEVVNSMDRNGNPRESYRLKMVKKTQALDILCRIYGLYKGIEEDEGSEIDKLLEEIDGKVSIPLGQS